MCKSEEKCQQSGALWIISHLVDLLWTVTCLVTLNLSCCSPKETPSSVTVAQFQTGKLLHLLTGSILLGEKDMFTFSVVCSDPNSQSRPVPHYAFNCKGLHLFMKSTHTSGQPAVSFPL